MSPPFYKPLQLINLSLWGCYNSKSVDTGSMAGVPGPGTATITRPRKGKRPGFYHEWTHGDDRLHWPFDGRPAVSPCFSSGYKWIADKSQLQVFVLHLRSRQPLCASGGKSGASTTTGSGRYFPISSRSITGEQIELTFSEEILNR